MADKYIYAVARIRALEMTLMSQAVIEQLVATDSYKKAVQFIIEKGWGDSDKASMDENDILRAETDKTWGAMALPSRLQRLLWLRWWMICPCSMS